MNVVAVLCVPCGIFGRIFGAFHLTFYFYHSEADSASPEVSIISRKDNPFLNSDQKKAKERDEEDEREIKQKTVIPNVEKDDLAKRRSGGGPLPPRDPHQSLVRSSITQSDLETWQRLKINTENRSFKNSSVCV